MGSIFVVVLLMGAAVAGYFYFARRRRARLRERYRSFQVSLTDPGRTRPE